MTDSPGPAAPSTGVVAAAWKGLLMLWGESERVEERDAVRGFEGIRLGRGASEGGVDVERHPVRYIYDPRTVGHEIRTNWRLGRYGTKQNRGELAPSRRD